MSSSNTAQVSRNGLPVQFRLALSEEDNIYLSLVDRVEASLRRLLDTSHGGDEISLRADIVCLSDPQDISNIVLPGLCTPLLLLGGDRTFKCEENLLWSDVSNVAGKIKALQMTMPDKVLLDKCDPSGLEPILASSVSGNTCLVIYVPGGKWHVRISVTDGKHMKLCSTKFNFSNNWSVDLLHRDGENTGSLALSMYPATLLNQYQRMQLGKTHGFTLLLQDFIRNALTIVKCIQNPHVHEQLPKLFYPGIFDLSADVRQHYNEKVDRFKAQDESLAGSIRKFNNLVKSIILSEYVVGGQGGRNFSGPCILDLACGHGQDLQKYTKKSPKLYIGVDISDAALKEAEKRHNESRTRYTAAFIEGNLTLPETYDEITRIARGYGVVSSNDYGVFDVISMQLSLHYLVGSRKESSFLIGMISKLLKQGGRFIATFPCCDRIARRLRNLQPSDETFSSLAFGNELYRVGFKTELLSAVMPELSTAVDERSVDSLDVVMDQVDFNDISQVLASTWGLQYKFWLVDTIDDQEEYVVPSTALSEVFKECGMEVELDINFSDVLQKFNKSPVYHAFQRNYPDLVLNSDEEDVFRFYKVLVARRT